jgi:murein DD-endopeptidase MepM/ murein hydrolase activator NlpD
MFGVTTNTILWANDLKKGTKLKPDQVLVILPISSIKYTVAKGDSIGSIAKKFKSDSREIAQFNSLDEDDKLTVGQDIMIPDADGSLLAAQNKKADEDAKKKLVKNAPRFNSNSKDYVDTTGYFSRPVVGGIRTQGIHGNNGVDIASKYGTPILAAASGQVIVSKSGGWGGGYGNYVVIKHSNGTQTLYGHMSEVLVSAGETVSRGQQIGKMGNTGRSTGVHLHFEVRGGRNPF